MMAVLPEVRRSRPVGRFSEHADHGGVIIAVARPALGVAANYSQTSSVG